MTTSPPLPPFLKGSPKIFWPMELALLVAAATSLAMVMHSQASLRPSHQQRLVASQSQTYFQMQPFCLQILLVRLTRGVLLREVCKCRMTRLIATIVCSLLVYTGFNAWSSVREPTQVFQLLESVYHHFDACASRRNVFKGKLGLAHSY
jgi:hypothetical protein